MTFTGFDAEAIALLDRLPDMDADEYAVHKARLAAGVTQPGGALIAEVAGRLDADLTVAPRSSVSPLHRDLRFAPEGAARFKDHLLLTAWEGADKKTSPMFRIRVDAHRAGFASGIGFTPEVRERWRGAVAGDAGGALAAELDRLVRDRGAEVAGDQVKKVPAPYDADHPRADLLRHTGFQVRFVEDLPDVTDPDFAGWCAERLDGLLPVHRWLVDHLPRTTSPEPPRPTVIDPKGRTMPQTDESVFWELIDELQTEDPRVEEGTIMGGRCARVAGEFLGLVDFEGGGLVVKLPRERVDELIEQGVGQPFAPAGKLFREWVAVPRRDRRRWRSLLREGIAFVAPS